MKLSHQLTPCSTVLGVKLTVAQLIKFIPRLSRNPKVHYCVHKITPLMPMVN